MPTLVMIRHGQSQWNLDNRFTGWTDVDLTPAGIAEARKGGKALSKGGYAFARCYTSVLKRAIRTLWLTLEEMDRMWLPQTCDWRLNERHYGALQGLNKAETAERHGEEQVRVWRRSYDIPPPSLELKDPRHPGNLPAYAAVPRSALPATESLKDTLARVMPLWEGRLAPELSAGDNLLIVAHGNSIRALCKHLFGIGDQNILSLEIPTGNPLDIQLDAALMPVSARYLDSDRAQALPL